jgi:lysophospholipase L1-like esterase
MRALITAALAAAVLAGQALAADPPTCVVPDRLVSGDYSLMKRVAATVARQHKLAIVVLGTGSSTLTGAEGPSMAYPARLEAFLNQKLSMVTVKVVSRTMSGQTADMMRRSMREMLTEQKPELVIWQTGTVDAIRRIEPDEFRVALEKGVDTLLSAGTDVVLMNMQYSPRTESMIAVGPYADGMHAVAQQREVPLFDRFAIMRYWADEGAFDFTAADRDNGLAQRVHECLGRAIGSLVIAAGRLQAFENKTGK